MYKRRSEVERLFRRLNDCCRIFFRFEKAEVMFLGFVSPAPKPPEFACVERT